MRLKGGKLLLDLSQYDLPNDEPTIPLSQEQIDAILTKGLIVKIETQYLTFIKEIIFTDVSDGSLVSNNILKVGAGNYLSCQLNLIGKELSIYF